MKQFPIIGTTIFIIMVIVGLIIYKTREGYTTNNYKTMKNSCGGCNKNRADQLTAKQITQDLNGNAIILKEEIAERRGEIGNPLSR